jgi:predicted nucleic acid-binding protein
MAVLIDTSVIIAAERHGMEPADLTAAVAEEDTLIASITASELLVGLHRADSGARHLRRQIFVEALLAALPVIPFDLGVARVHARLWAHLAGSGQMIGAHDLMIAATALHLNGVVLTYNVREFARVPGLEVRQPVW